MVVYTMIIVPVAVVAGVLLAVLPKKGEGVIFGPLDRIGRITNVLMIPIYVYSVPYFMFLGMVSVPAQDGFMGFLGGLAAFVISSSILFCGLGLGASVALRKKGRRILSFLIQFSGVAGFLISYGLYNGLVGSLLQTLN